MVVEKATQRLLETASPFLVEGETPEIASVAMVGPSRAKRNVALLAATLVASGGVAAVFTVPIKQYVLLTNRRLIFFAMNQTTGRPMPKVNAEIPRAGLSADLSRRGWLLTDVELTIPGDPTRLVLRFPLPARPDAYAMVASMPAPAPAPSSHFD
jgi:hypothetical protein